MATVQVTLFGLSEHHAKDLVVMALYEWMTRRMATDYVDTRYKGMSESFREARNKRLDIEMEALASVDINTLE